jgi:hypothetical protein
MGYKAKGTEAPVKHKAESRPLAWKLRKMSESKILGTQNVEQELFFSTSITRIALPVQA